MMNSKEMSEMNFAELTEKDMEQIAGGAKATTVTALKETTIRFGPGTEYLPMGKTIPGNAATFKGAMKQDKEGRAWIKVAWNGNVGWVPAKCCRMNPAR